MDLAGVRQTPGQAPYRDSSKVPLRVAIASILSPAVTLESYHDLLTYIGKRLGRPVELVQRRTYAEVNDLIRSRQIDLAFVCSLPYIEGKKEFGLELLVAPQIRGRVVYFSYLIVPDDSRANSLSDLKGKTFAFSDPLSNSGRLAPTYQLALMNETPDTFFGRYVFTYSHDNSIVAVADRLVDGAAVDSLVYDFLAAKDPGLVAKTKIIARWGPFGIPPVVVGPWLDPELKRTLKDLFLSMHEDDDGKRTLKALMIHRFVEVKDEQYESIRRMAEKVREGRGT
ncbi:MAG: phosphate/phosphite/phosphonate ABC transporter substrate-binding protein [candidate division NC10 bacterium]|nr:phosphate/phosphite/phosphonate ABC transporter substrate-binding protein [candidate division NC10 bacterium]